MARDPDRFGTGFGFGFLIFAIVIGGILALIFGVRF